MSSSRGLLTLAMVVLVGGVIGCNTVPRPEHDALQARYDELDRAYSDQALSLEDAKTNEGRLLGELTEHKRRVNATETEASRLRNELTRRQTTAAAPSKPQPSRDGTVVSLGSDSLFGAGSAALSDAGKGSVSDVGRRLVRQHAGATILVYGHTDSTPIKASKWADNLELSAHRALAVARELIKAGVAAKKIETIAMGATQPVASNKTESGRTKNRRVVIKVVK